MQLCKQSHVCLSVLYHLYWMFVCAFACHLLESSLISWERTNKEVHFVTCHTIHLDFFSRFLQHLQKTWICSLPQFFGQTSLFRNSCIPNVNGLFYSFITKNKYDSTSELLVSLKRLMETVRMSCWYLFFSDGDNLLTSLVLPKMLKLLTVPKGTSIMSTFAWFLPWYFHCPLNALSAYVKETTVFVRDIYIFIYIFM